MNKVVTDHDDSDRTNDIKTQEAVGSPPISETVPMILVHSLAGS